MAKVNIVWIAYALPGELLEHIFHRNVRVLVYKHEYYQDFINKHF